VLEGEAATRLLALGGVPAAGPVAAVAVRRSALVLADDGPLGAVVVSARATPDQVRLVVEAEGLGTLDAVASRGRHPAVGERVRLRLDATRLAIVGPA
jgi:thiamine transport system ATP-binding protein